ncbi:Substance-K receptor [Exaiptasia diaphana]|nr:Substance-K receptor [Exaiptasia diaphana]
MSIADLLVTITYMPRVVSLWFAGYVWQVDGLTGLVFCKIACFNEVAILVAIFTIIAISIDRFLAVVFPLRRGLITIPICQTMIGFMWLAAIAAAFSEFYAIELRTFNGDIYCYLDLDYFFGEGSSKAYFNFIIIGFFAIPFTAIIILYSGIIAVLLKRRRIPGDASAVDDAQKRRREETKKKVLKMVMAVVGTYCRAVVETTEKEGPEHRSEGWKDVVETVENKQSKNTINGSSQCKNV